MRRLRGVLLDLFAWTVPAVLSTSLIMVRQPGPDGQATWWTSLAGQLPSWWIWAALTPLVLALARRIEIAGPKWWRPLLVHGVLGFGVVVLYIAAEAPFAIMREGRVVTPASWFSALLGGLTFRFVTNYVIYFALVGVGHAIWASRRLREREIHASKLEAQLADARLESLKAQLQPHFLFNTLHAIGGLVREGDSGRAVRMIAGLSGLLRHTLDQVRAPEIPFHAELEALERYLEIEEVRFEDRLEVVRAIDPDVADVQVPALLLQPLVENAIRHGIEKRAGAGRVDIAARNAGGMLEVRVADDGFGIATDFDLERDAGVGLTSSRRRLERLYGTSGSIAVRRLDPHGTEVIVRIPTEKRQ